MWRYGLLGLPLAFLALPLYLSLPAHYAQTYGVPLASLGALLLGVRLGDALLDPWIGRGVDAGLRSGRLFGWMVAAALLMLTAFIALFFAPAGVPLLPWAGVALVLAYAGYSVLGVGHQAWGARLGGDTHQQARWVAWREGFALAGVLLASLLISTAGWVLTCTVLAVGLAVGLWALKGVAPPPAPLEANMPLPWRLPWRTKGFRALLAVHALNGTAAAVPATVLLFFVQDQLQAGAQQGLFLACYFLAAAASLPLWLRAVRRFGAVRAWSLGMVLAVVAFVWAGGLGAGDAAAFTAICLATGVAAGADLAIAPALLTGVVQRAGLAGRAEGVFFGWWTAANKLNLALAAGLALPLLHALGYQPGQLQGPGVSALSIVYAWLPCALKLLALALLGLVLREPKEEAPS